MSVKRYEWVACDEHSCHCDVVESAEGDMVDYDDYAALEARCAALAAENAGLKAAHKSAIDVILNPKNKATLYVDSTIIMGVSTQATDAFLDEVRAQGVDVAIEHLINKFEGTGRIGVPVMALEWLAKELRKGAQS